MKQETDFMLRDKSQNQAGLKSFVFVAAGSSDVVQRQCAYGMHTMNVGRVWSA